jgi:hypothetical protein
MRFGEKDRSVYAAAGAMLTPRQPEGCVPVVEDAPTRASKQDFLLRAERNA